MKDEEIIDGILEREGSVYTDRGDDRGGPTKFGITLATLRDWRQLEVTAADVEALTETEARDIYRHLYIGRPGLGLVLDDGLRALLVDCAVLHGPKNAVKFLQRSVGVTVDGIFGDETRLAVQRFAPARLRIEVFAQRLEFLGRLISHDLTDGDRDGIPDAAENAGGWINRCAALLRRLV